LEGGIYFLDVLKIFLPLHEFGQRLRNIGETEDKPYLIGA
jgi:hypothetical protein